MLCWVCERLRADRGGVCHVCRQAVRNPAAVKARRGTLRIAAVLAGVVSVAASVLTPAVVSPPPLPWRTASNLEIRRTVPALPIRYVTTMVEQEVKRRVYPYSIVPGGAEDVRQARIAMTDPAVKAHYADVNLPGLKQVTLETNLVGYVSYRWGEKIYWTTKTLTLRAGEKVFTDGVHIVRGRCLNCYSAHPMLPTRPREPTEKAMDAPVEMPVTVYSFPKLPVLAPELPIPPGELTPVVPDIPRSLASVVGKAAGGRFWFPILPIIPPIHRHPSNPPSNPAIPLVPGTPPVIPPVAIVPEPHYAWLLLAGFGVLIICRRRRRVS